MKTRTIPTVQEQKIIDSLMTEFPISIRSVNSRSTTHYAPTYVVTGWAVSPGWSQKLASTFRSPVQGKRECCTAKFYPTSQSIYGQNRGVFLRQSLVHLQLPIQY